MKRIILIAGLFICLATPLFSQDNTDEPAVKLPEAVMEQVVQRIVTWYFKAPKKPKTIYLAADYIKKEWLPSVKNIEFVVLSSDSEGDRKFYFFHELERSGRGYAVGFGYGDRCESIGDPWAFRVQGSRVRLWERPGGWGTGCGISRALR